MNISSTPFIRNDYWPDYNDIDILNKRIDEAENETSLVNSRLTNDIENVSNNLNSYKNAMADTVITNNIIVNNLNANYAVGKYANFVNTNTDNAYIENLTVNKPVFDITLNTPHIENATSLGGNFYDANLINPSFEGTIGLPNLDSLNVNSLAVNTANVKELFVNTQPEPVTSSAVLGYDSKGRVIPVHAAFDVGFPEDANYLFTDHTGTAFAGTAATEVGISSNLITAYAVKNAIDNVNDSLNIINSSLNDVDSWMNTIENDVNNRFEEANNSFNNINNSFNNVNNTANNLLDNVDYLKTALAPLLSLPVANVSGWINSTSPVNIQGIKNFVVASFAAPSMLDAADVGDGAKLEVTGTTARLGLPGFQWTMGTMNGTFCNCKYFNQNVQIPDGVTSMINTLQGCRDLQNVYTPDTFTNIYDCVNDSLHYVVNATFNQNIKLPSSLTNMSGMLSETAFNQNIAIPEGVIDMSEAFSVNRATSFIRYASNNNLVKIDGQLVGVHRYIGQFNQNITIPNSVTNMAKTFVGQVCFNQNIMIPNSVVDMSNTFTACYDFNQNILIPNSVTNMYGMISGYLEDKVSKRIKDNIVSDVNHMAFNQPNMYIFSQNITNMNNAFGGCSINNIHIPTSVPKATSNFMYNCLVNGDTGITFPAANIFNDLPVDLSIYKEQFTELSVDLGHEYKMTINPETYNSSWSVTNGGTLQNGFFIYKDGNSIEYLSYIKFNSSSQIAEGDAYGRTTKLYRITSPGTLTQLFGDVSGNKQILPTGTLVTTDNGKVYRKLEPSEWS